MKYVTYHLLRASGKIEKMKVPMCFDSNEVAKKFPHSEIFVEVPKKHFFLVDYTVIPDTDRFISTFFYIRRDGKTFEIPSIPRDDIEAAKMTDPFYKIAA